MWEGDTHLQAAAIRQENDKAARTGARFSVSTSLYLHQYLFIYVFIKTTTGFSVDLLFFSIWQGFMLFYGTP